MPGPGSSKDTYKSPYGEMYEGLYIPHTDLTQMTNSLGPVYQEDEVRKAMYRAYGTEPPPSRKPATEGTVYGNATQLWLDPPPQSAEEHKKTIGTSTQAEIREAELLTGFTRKANPKERFRSCDYCRETDQQPAWCNPDPESNLCRTCEKNGEPCLFTLTPKSTLISRRGAYQVLGDQAAMS